MTKYTKAELNKKTVADLKELAEENGIDLDDLEDTKKSTLVEALADIEIDEDELEDEVDLDEELDEEEDSEEDDLEEELPEEDEIEEKPKAAAKKPRAKKESSDEEGGTLAAKQVATLLGTDAKVLRQFFRSPASTTEAVGSGGRYEFAEADVPKIKAEFEAWKAGHASRGAKRGSGEGSTRSRSKRGPRVAEVTEVEEVEELEIEELEDPDLEEELDLEDED